MSTEWGARTEDVAVSLAVDKTTFVSGEPIPLHISLRNFGTEPVMIVERSPWIDHLISVQDENGNPVPETEQWRRMKEAAEEVRRARRQLMPGETITETVRLDEAFDLATPGRYTIRVQRHVHQRGTVADFALATSQDLVIQIVPPTAAP